MLEQKANYKDLVILKDDTHPAFGCQKQDCVVVEGGTRHEGVRLTCSGRPAQVVHNFDEYLAQKRKLGTWLNFTDCGALAYALGYHLTVIDISRYPYYLHKTIIFTYERTKIIEFIFYLSYN